VANPKPELVEALSLAGVPRPRLAALLGISVAVLDRTYSGHLKSGPKIPAARVAMLVRNLLEIAAQAQVTDEIPALIAAIKLLAPLHLPELAKSWQPPKESGDQLPPVNPEIGHDDSNG
jgi:hypothetical protein